MRDLKTPLATLEWLSRSFVPLPPTAPPAFRVFLRITDKRTGKRWMRDHHGLPCAMWACDRFAEQSAQIRRSYGLPRLP